MARSFPLHTVVLPPATVGGHELQLFCDAGPEALQLDLLATCTAWHEIMVGRSIPTGPLSSEELALEWVREQVILARRALADKYIRGEAKERLKREFFSQYGYAELSALFMMV
jgi:hypothetical protein